MLWYTECEYQGLQRQFHSQVPSNIEWEIIQTYVFQYAQLNDNMLHLTFNILLPDILKQ